MSRYIDHAREEFRAAGWVDAGNKAWDAAREAQRKILAEVREVLT